MDNKKRIKALIMLGVSMMSLSGCSKQDITEFLSDKYKIMKEYNLDNSEEENFLLVKVEKNLIEKNKLKIIGSFNTMEEAKDYLNNLSKDDNHQFGIEGIFGIIMIGGFFYYCISNYVKGNKKEKTLKK